MVITSVLLLVMVMVMILRIMMTRLLVTRLLLILIPIISSTTTYSTLFRWSNSSNRRFVNLRKQWSVTVFRIIISIWIHRGFFYSVFFILFYLF
ncbi:hypothetical protein GLOIN_2v1515209 [Rhizophagus irregularis DAOM 181602=DAOM 197198]|uniref:Uncharacterized protein n=1 Tax=Rhizophagus irregularis (strain DAOM 181602 / DAOM 197198 / MUCL 43194) TaxID=747089 RepID=A0A2P4QSW8_RHIID|nr:hypothetical protein GLOIN_2v1515209 [Rhizophagus irregularis DAOM 181602=DAOM 197198]POG80733.1 hypothetical protein GLOIN_2v1515209 [Rhizophagus irregularis DAOM 181602=DAOM 197198]|eukprot:XP_025187599.1 hypothetical protein GLOIN_2v1515209 [Rhizophagus irregularis DAOM 181602=DAOM 197198]